ncbi:MAG TPA: PQQ-dependent sugar dehydrogenase, partial [Pyrinomonadaceae bacterium]|nr:PQQ-dependent sugar dehydrogenase [Pyrinomonadaceae bacterium]
MPRSNSQAKTSPRIQIFLLFFVFTFGALTAFGAQVPDGFTVTQVATGMTSVTRMALLPDGRILVLEQGGKVRIIENGVLRSTPYLTVDADSFSEHGLLGIALDPAFSTNNFFYVYYTAKTPNIHNRVSRFTAGPTIADPASEAPLFDMDESTGPLGWHQGGNIGFGPDGKLYVAVGDDRNGDNSQSFTTLFGKILRINSDGSIPSDNPFFQTASGKYRAIWALGLRNPYSFAFSNLNQSMFINDVGEDTWEEINRGISGGNYGWPETEGFTSDPRFQSPIVAYAHGSNSDSLGCAITAGAFYEPGSAQFPAQYTGSYFYADFCEGWIRSLQINNLSSQVFAHFTNFPVDLKVAKDGTLYYLERGQDTNTGGAVFKINFTSQQSPVITQQPANAIVAAGQPVSFSVQASGAAPLSYRWQRNGVNLDGPGTDTPTLTITPQLTDNGALYACVVSNQFGSVTSNAAQLTVVKGSAPVASITLPVAGTVYHGGDVIQYAGTGTDA